MGNPAIKALDKQLQQPWSGNRTRSCFIEYFEVKRAHPFWASSPVVPVNDPTLLFTNAGMNQFKPIFLGTVEPTSELGKLSRAANSQVRAIEQQLQNQIKQSNQCLDPKIIIL